MAGFRGPLFLLGLSSGGQKAGFRGILPVPFLGGTSAIQAGFRGILPVPFLGGGTVVVPTDPCVPSKILNGILCNILVDILE